MNFSGLIVQLLNGLASASSLFLVAAGLSLIFGVTRIVNFAHGSFFMLGTYIAYTLVDRLGTQWGFWPSVVIAALAVGVLGALIELLLLRRIYKAPELFQLLATFALVLVIKDAVLYLWGPEELLGPRAPGLSGSVEILGRQFPSYDLFLIVVGPLVLGAVWLLLTRTRFGTLVRAATQDREMVSALGVNQVWLFTAVFALGAMLAGLGGALQLPREPAHLEMDLNTIGAAFVVVVVGGMGSLPGAYLAALLISLIKALCIWLGVVELFGHSVSFSKATLVVDFVVMAAVLIWRPWGLLGRPQG
ncbi:MAG: branched-chain amino acid ABC transporter permease, partial [Ottowia sp.]|nr:branched-chain amino acid ABC transporter permease [Ottowia sp.]